jgi:tetratricopeptide (TPR) repeat protein
LDAVDVTPEALAREVERLHRAGRSDDAFALALETAARFPNSSLALTNVGYFYILRGEPALALETYEAALRANADNAEARRGLAVAKTQCGLAAQGDSTTIVPYRGEERPVRVLVPITLGSGNVVTDHLFDDAVFEVTKLAVELHSLDGGLPPHDVVFNAIGDADSSRDALAKARLLLARTNKYILNAPDYVAITGRVAQSMRLRDLEDVVMPKIASVSREEARTVATPVLLRALGFHAGRHFLRVDDVSALDAAIEQLPGDDLLAIEPFDIRGRDGTYAKYRAMLIDGALYPLHLAISPDWKVHYFSAQMAANAAYREREAQFLANPRRALGVRTWAALERVAQTLFLKYAGIDFGVDAQGRVVVFETNATMAVRYPSDEYMWAYRRPSVDAVLGAVRAMLLRYSSI